MTPQAWARESLVWACVVFALPACSLLVDGGPGTNIVRGDEPRSAVFCDIEVARRCATEEDLLLGIPFEDAGVALVSSPPVTHIGLDYRSDECGGNPQAVIFHGPYPAGLPVCVNCGGVIGSDKEYATALDVCLAQCYDLTGGSTEADGTIKPKVPPTEDTIESCRARTRVSTNVPYPGCFDGACTSTGVPTRTFSDPRRIAEPVVWIDRIGVSTTSDEIEILTRSTAPTGAFDAGAVSEQWLRRGSGWVEFSLNRTDRAVAIGFSEIPAGCVSPIICPETDPSRDHLHFGLSMGADGLVYVFVRGQTIRKDAEFEAWGPYAAGERFRVGVRQNPLGGTPLTGTVYFARVPADCAPGINCPIDTFYTHALSSAVYPMRVKASFREQASLTDVRVVRIK